MGAGASAEETVGPGAWPPCEDLRHQLAHFFVLGDIESHGSQLDNGIGLKSSPS